MPPKRQPPVYNYITDDEEILVFKKRLKFDWGPYRGNPIGNNPNEYVLSGGRMEKGETPERAAIREFYEETGVKLGDPEVSQVEEFVDGRFTYYVRYAKYSPADYQAIKSSAEDNLSKADKLALGGDFKGAAKIVPDGELQPEVNSWVPSYTKEVFDDQKDTDWYANAIEEAPQAFKPEPPITTTTTTTTHATTTTTTTHATTTTTTTTTLVLEKNK